MNEKERKWSYVKEMDTGRNKLISNQLYSIHVAKPKWSKSQNCLSSQKYFEFSSPVFQGFSRGF